MSKHQGGKKKQNSSEKKKYKFRKTNYTGDYSLKEGELERIEQLAYNAYSNEMLTPTSQIMNMKFYDTNEIAMRGYEPFFKPILHYLWRTDPNNWEKMNAIQNKYYKKVFPNNPEMKLGIDSMLKFDDLQKAFLNFQNKKRGGHEYTGKQFKYAFSENYIKTLVKAPKLGLYHYESNNRLEDKNASSADPTYKRRIIDIVALKVDGETLLGEIETVYKGAPKYFTPDELNGSVKFTLYYQGNPDMPIDIMRDDFIKTGSAHSNKIDSNYHFILDHRIPRNTKFSHRHYLSDILQLPFTKPNQSINVEPLPINKFNTEKGERKYNTLLDMRKDSWSSLNFDGKVVDEKSLLTKRLKKTIDETLSGKELTSKYGKLITNDEIAECQAKYNRAMKQVKDRDIDSYLMSGGVDEDSLARHDIRQAYFRVTKHKLQPMLKSDTEVSPLALDDDGIEDVQQTDELSTL